MIGKLSLATLGLALAAITYAENQFILRYTESEPLTEFLSRYELELNATVTNRPIHAVRDPLNRDPEALIELISNDTDDDVSIELDQRVQLPIRSFVVDQTGGLAQLVAAMRMAKPTAFFGVSAPQGSIQQEAIRNIRANSSWAAHGLGAGIVAVIDTGVDLRHSFFKGRLAPGIDYLTAGGSGSELTGLSEEVRLLVNPTTTPLLRRVLARVSGGLAPFFEESVRNHPNFPQIPFAFGHGTMVAGAVRLVAPNARILPIRAFDQEGYASLFTVIRSIHAAEDRGARVVNLSMNTYTYSPELEQTVQDVSDRGLMLVASTGNDGLTDVASYPASMPKVTGVASVDSSLRRSLFSNAGAALTWVSAPGEALLLPYPGQRWAGGWGTSFSAPLVSGLAAKIILFKPEATFSDLQSALGRSSPLNDPTLGKGFLDILASASGF